MKKDVFISDLDGTLVFSKSQIKTHNSSLNNSICVEEKEGKQISYVSEEGLTLINEVLKKVEFIPCSMRNKEQILRINFIKDYNPKYMIASNGASIYIDGELDINWDEYMRKIIPKNEIQKLIEDVKGLNTSTSLIYNVDDFYLALSFKDNEEASSYVDILKTIIPNRDYLVYALSRKVYLINKNINKVHAVNYLRNKYNLCNIHTAGDTLVDKEFTAIQGVKSYLPKHATFKHDSSFITENCGIDSLEELLKEININLNEYSPT